MSLFRPDVWFPEFVDYQVRFFEEPIFLADYTAATLFATLFSGVQLIAGGYIFRQYVFQSWRNRPRREVQKRRHIPSDPLFYISMAIVVLYSVSVVLACVAYGQRYSSLTRLNEFSRTREETLRWFREDSDHEGVKMICIPASVGVGRQEFCKTFKLAKNLLSYKGVEIAYASVIEALIMTVDGILIYRFYMMFSTARWIYPAISILILASLVGPVIGIVALAKLAVLGAKSDPWWSANFSNSEFLDWHSPWVAVALPVFVNVVVTVAIITKITRTRYRVRKLVGNLHHDSAYLSLTATLVESALPAALFGIMAAVFPRVHMGQTSGKRLNFSPTMIWVAFTALSPQFIIIRVLQGRAWNREVAGSTWSSPDVPLMFANETQGTGHSTTVDSEPKDVVTPSFLDTSVGDVPYM